jgi:hypothetical protein
LRAISRTLKMRLPTALRWQRRWCGRSRQNIPVNYSKFAGVMVGPDVPEAPLARVVEGPQPDSAAHGDSGGKEEIMRNTPAHPVPELPQGYVSLRMCRIRQLVQVSTDEPTPSG